MLFVGTSIIHPSTEGVFLLCNILDLLIYSKNFEMEQSSRLDETDIPSGCSFCQGRWEDE